MNLRDNTAVPLSFRNYYIRILSLFKVVMNDNARLVIHKHPFGKKFFEMALRWPALGTLLLLKRKSICVILTMLKTVLTTENRLAGRIFQRNPSRFDTTGALIRASVFCFQEKIKRRFSLEATSIRPGRADPQERKEDLPALGEALRRLCRRELVRLPHRASICS